MCAYQAPASCPVCGEKYKISRLTCEGCGSELSGQFEGCKFCKLPESDQYFIKVFLSSRGNIKDVEKALGISYPTVRGRLDAVIKRLGLENTKANKGLDAEERKEIFKKLEDGEITAAEATKILKEGV